MKTVLILLSLVICVDAYPKQKRDASVLLKADVSAITAELKASVLDEFKNKYANLREGCFPRPKSGCQCNEKDAEGNEIVTLYGTKSECQVKPATTRVKCQAGSPGCPVRRCQAGTAGCP